MVIGMQALECTGNRQFYKNFTVQNLQINPFGFVHLLSPAYILPKWDHNENIWRKLDYIFTYVHIVFYLKQENSEN